MLISDMSDCVGRPSHDEDATSMTSSQAQLPIWMSRWMNRSSKPVSTADNSPLVSYKEGHNDVRGHLAQNDLCLQTGNGGREGGELNLATTNENLGKNSENSNNKPKNVKFPTLNLFQNNEKGSAMGSLRTEIDHEFENTPMALALAIGKEDGSRVIDSRSGKQQVMSHLYHGQKGVAVSRSSAFNTPDASKPVVVFERHFSNDNFTCFSQDRCKYQKSSSVLFHEKMENNLCHESGPSDPKKVNFQSLFLKNQSKSVLGQKALDRGPCSFRNVETMRICTMVDSVEESPGDPPKISQRAHHILFTKETCVNVSKGHQVVEEPTLGHREEKTYGGCFSTSPNGTSHAIGVKIQPLWTSTDSEGNKTTGKPSACKVDSMHEASAETDGMEVEAPKNQHITLGAESTPSTKTPSTKDDTMDENSPPAACDSSTEKAKSKRPITEIPDINEEFLGLQSAASSTDNKDPNTSRVHSLNAKQLFSCHEQTSNSECNVRKDRSFGPDTSNRWIKRLKLSSSDSFGVGTKSSDVGEGSSHEKFNTFFNKITKCNKDIFDANLGKNHGKEQMAIDQTVESLGNSGSLSMGSDKKKQSMLNGSSWIQRWCQRGPVSPQSNPEPLVICEPHSLKSGQDELAKKQFPSIAAMALMGKAMHGFRSCEFKKKGPIVVWNTKE